MAAEPASWDTNGNNSWVLYTNRSGRTIAVLNRRPQMWGDDWLYTVQVMGVKKLGEKQPLKPMPKSVAAAKKQVLQLVNGLCVGKVRDFSNSKNESAEEAAERYAREDEEYDD